MNRGRDRLRQTRWHRGCPGSSGADFQCVVAALAIDASDRMDRHEIKNVEAHLPDFRQPADAIIKGGAFAGGGSLRTREHFVPGRIPSGPPVGGYRILMGIERDIRLGAVIRHQRMNLWRKQELFPFCGRSECAGLIRFRAQQAVRRSRPQAHLQDFVTFANLQGRILAGLLFLTEIPAPAFEQIHPGLDGENIAAHIRQLEGADPTVIVEKPHGRAAPFFFVFVAVFDGGAQRVMTITEYIGPDFDFVADQPLHRIPAGIQFRINILDDDAPHRIPFRMMRAAGEIFTGHALSFWLRSKAYGL